MPANTPNLGLPYPLPTDQVSEGASDIQALAEAVDPILANSVDAPGVAGERWRLYGGLIGPFNIGAGQVLDKGVSYPVAFAAAPFVVATGEMGATGAMEPILVWIISPGPAGFTCRVRNDAPGVVPAAIRWLALGPTGAAPGLLPAPEPEPEPEPEPRE
jgi:hypothetical protein